RLRTEQVAQGAQAELRAVEILRVRPEAHARAGVLPADRADDLQRRGAIAVAEADAVLAAFALDVYLHQRGQRIDHAHADAMQAAGEDRKSTRLNSSHVKISYAVFCLKKKTSKSTYPAR